MGNHLPIIGESIESSLGDIRLFDPQSFEWTWKTERVSGPHRTSAHLGLVVGEYLHIFLHNHPIGDEFISISMSNHHFQPNEQRDLFEAMLTNVHHPDFHPGRYLLD